MTVFVAVPGLVLGIGFCQVLMEIVYEGDMRAFTGHKRSFAAGAAAAVAGYLFFALDISGYDTWIPAPEQVESAAIEIGLETIIVLNMWMRRMPSHGMNSTDWRL